MNDQSSDPFISRIIPLSFVVWFKFFIRGMDEIMQFTANMLNILRHLDYMARFLRSHIHPFSR